MNAALSDAVNLAWKIHAVEGGFAKRRLLETYQSERKGYADSLLDFDSRYARLFSSRLPTHSELLEAAADGDGVTGNNDNEFIKAFKDSRRFTSGYGVRYEPNMINWSPNHPVQSPLIQPNGVKLEPGGLFINADVTRVVDANTVHLEQVVPMDGTFRIYIFAGDPSVTRKALQDFAEGLDREQSFYRAGSGSSLRHISRGKHRTPSDGFYTLCTLLATKRGEVDISRDVPGILSHHRDHIYADDVWDRSVPDANAAAHAKTGLGEICGGVVVVRPDGHVALVTSLTEGAGTVNVLNDYFSTL